VFTKRMHQRNQIVTVLLQRFRSPALARAGVDSG
jgi:hypothetical protein